MKTILIFGATGTVGAYTSLYLKEKGYDIIAVGRRDSDNRFFLDYKIKYFSVDITNKKSFEKLPTGGIYAVINLAGILPARMEGYHPQCYIDINITGCLNILDYCAKIGINRIIYSQSISDVDYLCGKRAPIKSNAISKFPLDNDHSIYSISKNAAVSLMIHYAVHYKFKYYVLRFPNIYLYHPNPYYYVNGAQKWQSYRLLIHKAMHGEPIEVWGDPQKVKDVVYVKDCCQIIEGCIRSENAKCGYYNVGTGVGVSLENQIKGIIQIFSPANDKSEIRLAPDMPNSSEYIFDISATKKELGYQPKYDYMEYLKDFKSEMKKQTFQKLWGKDLVENI